MQREVGGWLLAASYLGNRSTHLWRVLELNPAVFGPGATTGNTNQRRVLFLQNPDQGRFYGTIAQLDDTGRAKYNAMFLQVQRRLKNDLSVLSNWTLSKCMSDPATTEITGPTVVDPNNPDMDYSYCASDRRHVVNLSIVWTTPRWGWGPGRPARQLADLAAGALAERQPLERDDRPGQRAERHARPRRRTSAAARGRCRSSTTRMGTARRRTT